MKTLLRRAGSAWLCVLLAAGLVLDDATALVVRPVGKVNEHLPLHTPGRVAPEPQSADFLLDDDDECLILDDDGDDATDGYCAMQAIIRTQPAADIEQLTDDYDLDIIADISGQPVYLLSLPPRYDEVQTVADLAMDSRVVWAELNRVDRAPEGRPQRFFLRGQEPLPGSMNQAYAPHLVGITAPGACGTGAGVRIAVIDSGIDPSHPAFENTDLRHAWNAFSNQDGLGNVDDIGNDEDDDLDGYVDEMTGHGTHVTGIITQIAPQATIIPIKALDSDGLGQAFYLARALAYAVDREAEIINLSLGSTADARVVREAVNEALQTGTFVAAAAGNNGGQEPIEYPGAQTGVFAVAATDRLDRRADFSSYHPAVSLSAPGVDIVGPFPLDQPPGAKLGSDYALWSGTSMATPFVSGAAALLLAQNPAHVADDIAARLRTTADPISGSANGMGSGRLDAGAALGCAGEEPPPTVTPPSGEQQATANPDAGQDKDKKKKKSKRKKNGKKKRRG